MAHGMAQPILLRVIGDDADHMPITIPVGEIVIGREPDEGVELPFQSISREHGILANFGGQWFFQDLESTNGSWINGLEAVPREWSLLRHHDYLQLADRVFRVTVEEEEDLQTHSRVYVANSHGRCLCFFVDGRYHDEILIPQEGQRLTVGGNGADIQLRVDISANPGLVIEQRTESLVAYSVELGHNTSLNDDLLLRTTELHDRDVIRIGEYLIIVHDPPALDQNGIGAGFTAGSGGTRTDLREWRESEQRHQIQPPISESTDRKESREKELSESVVRESVASESVASESVATQESTLNERATIMFSEQEAPFSLGEWESAHDDSDVSFSRRPTLVGQFGRLREEADEDGHPDSINTPHSYGLKDTATASGERLTFFVAILLFLLLFVLVAWWLFLS